MFYLINYGFEVYGDRCLTEDPYDHGPKVVDLLQSREFPGLDDNPLIDDVINKCWHNEYSTVSQLAMQTQFLMRKGTDVAETGESRKGKGREVVAILEPSFINQFFVSMNRIFRAVFSGIGSWWMLLSHYIMKSKGNERNDVHVEQGTSEVDMVRKREICQDLEKRGLLELLLSGEPEQIGFSFDWYRHSLSC